jgi:hypothetical protein
VDNVTDDTLPVTQAGRITPSQRITGLQKRVTELEAQLDGTHHDQEMTLAQVVKLTEAFAIIFDCLGFPVPGYLQRPRPDQPHVVGGSPQCRPTPPRGKLRSVDGGRR